MNDSQSIIEPMDEHNRTLVGHVHPTGWQNPSPSGRYNMVVIGAGTAGLVTAAGSAGLGAKVALIERHLMGGDCLNVGCVPSKAIIASASRGENFPGAMQRMRKLRAGIAEHDSAERFRSLGVDVYFGEARFKGRDSVQVGGQTLRFSKACIATGARAAAPPIDGIEQIEYLTNENVFELTELPRKLAIIGAGPIGCEMAQAFARFGSEVYLIEAMHGVLPRDDEDAGRIVLDALNRDGVQLMCCGKNLKVEKTDDGARLMVESHGEGYDITVGKVLVAVGRAPNVEGLGLEEAGVAYDKKGVQVDDRLRTTNRRIFAAGDICTPLQFTHTADAHARIVIRNALFGFLPFKGRAADLVVPWCTYTSPEVAHVGEKSDDEEHTIRIDLSDVDRSVVEGQDAGFIKVHLKSGSDRIIGATIVAQHAGDMISIITSAMTHGIGLGKLAKTIFPYPTQSECIKQAADAFNRMKLTPRTKSIFAKLMSWQR